MYKVSIIIPVYNVEKYLRKCLDSVINQTYPQLEILCVNDGSTDNSEKILKEYSKKDGRIKILNKENGGLSSARNYGLDKATGEYCYFLDSDDWIELDTIAYLVKLACLNNVDCIVHSVKNIPEDENCVQIAKECQDWFDCKNKSAGIYDVPLNINNEIAAVAWNKLYKMDIIKKYNCRFPEGLINEDEAFIWTYVTHCNKYYYTNECLYNYLRRSDSIMAVRDNSPKVLDILDIQKIIFKTVEKYKDINSYREVLTNNYINEVRWLWQRMPKKYRKIALEKIKDYIDTTNNNRRVKKLYKDLKYKNFKSFVQGLFSVININNSEFVGKQVKILGLKFKSRNKYQSLLNKIESNKRELIAQNLEASNKIAYLKEEMEKQNLNTKILIMDSISSNVQKSNIVSSEISTNNHDENIFQSLKSLGEFYFLPNKGNLGDVVIASSEFQYLDANKFSYKVYDLLNLRQCSAPFNFVYGGGGLWHKLYQQDYQEILNIFKCPLLNKCVVLPSSFYDCEDVIAAFNEKFVVFCREKQSYDYCKSLNDKATFILADDMVIGANFEMYNNGFYNPTQINKFTNNSNITIESYIELYKKYSAEKNRAIAKLETIEDFSVGYLLREDKEKVFNIDSSAISMDISSYLGGYGCDKSYDYICTKLFLELINKFDIVVTDRLHIGICATKLGKRVLLIDNSYKKLSEVYKNSLYKFPNVKLTTVDDLSHDIEEMKNIKYEKNQYDFSIPSFTEFMTQYASFENEYGIERRFW